MALTPANKVITSALKTFQPVAIHSATMAITFISGNNLPKEMDTG